MFVKVSQRILILYSSKQIPKSSTNRLQASQKVEWQAWQSSFERPDLHLLLPPANQNTTKPTKQPNRRLGVVTLSAHNLVMCVCTHQNVHTSDVQMQMPLAVMPGKQTALPDVSTHTRGFLCVFHCQHYKDTVSSPFEYRFNWLNSLIEFMWTHVCVNKSKLQVSQSVRQMSGTHAPISLSPSLSLLLTYTHTRTHLFSLSNMCSLTHKHSCSLTTN